MNIIMIIITILQINTAIPQYQFKSTSIYNEKNTVYTEKTIYTEELNNNSNNKSGPRKVSGLDGWTFWILWGSYNGVPSNASNSDMYDYYDYIQSGGTLSYNDWWNQKYLVPVGEPLIPLLVLTIIYIYYKIKYKQNEQYIA